MCMFTGPIRHVSGTAIFARADEGDRQMLAYQMKVGSDAPVAMVLPLPVAAGAGEDALRFVDLSDYDDLFEQMARAIFPVPAARGFGAPQALTLEVQRVGNFVASFVPSLADFSRLDARFRLAPEVWTALPRYADWGFAVFRLAPDGDQKVHPMAFSFPRRDPSRLFFHRPRATARCTATRALTTSSSTRAATPHRRASSPASPRRCPSGSPRSARPNVSSTPRERAA
ncbi:MAG: hypothetical protein R3B99_09550 [Polyangiales bacterium]